MSDEQLRAVMHQLAINFRDNAPMTAAQAATVILDGVRNDRWRILVGEDAKALDRMVRETPEDAYERDVHAGADTRRATCGPVALSLRVTHGRAPRAGCLPAHFWNAGLRAAGAAQQRAERVDVDGLRQVVVEAGGERARLVLVPAVAGERDERHLAR
jgi:hypothetical protein